MQSLTSACEIQVVSKIVSTVDTLDNNAAERHTDVTVHLSTWTSRKQLRFPRIDLNLQLFGVLFDDLDKVLKTFVGCGHQAQVVRVREGANPVITNPATGPVASKVI